MRALLTIVTLLFCYHVSFAQNDQQIIGLGNKLYKQKQFDQAAAQYQKVLSDTNVHARYNLGDAFYRANKLDQAEKIFGDVAENAKQDDMRSNAYYNKGVSLSQQKKLLESIDAYKDALRIMPDDFDARENLQKALNELKKQQQKSSSQNDKKKDQDKKDDPKNPQQNKSKLNQKQAEQMLNALRQEEKAIQKDVQKNKNRSGSVPEKDW